MLVDLAKEVAKGVGSLFHVYSWTESLLSSLVSLPKIPHANLTTYTAAHPNFSSITPLLLSLRKREPASADPSTGIQAW